MTPAVLSLSPSTSASAVLGGEAVLQACPQGVRDWIPLVRQGLPAACVDAVVRITHITRSELAKALAIPERTLARRKREGTLSPEESVKFVRLARVVERAEAVFEEAPAALAWLQSPNYGAPTVYIFRYCTRSLYRSTEQLRSVREISCNFKIAEISSKLIFVKAYPLSSIEISPIQVLPKLLFTINCSSLFQVQSS